MIRLHPIPEAQQRCPFCDVPLEVRGWYIPGMRNLSSLQCSLCQRRFYGDLPTAQAIFTPLLIECASGTVHDPYGVTWFAEWLHDSYANRSSSALDIEVKAFRTVHRPLLLNCLDRLYGHAVLKLLNAQFHLDHDSDFDLVVIVPRILRWMVPEGVAEIWAVDLPLSQGTSWNDGLAAEIRGRIERFSNFWLSSAVPHPDPKHYDISRFTKIRPFPLAEWNARLQQGPAITFICRDDRTWTADTKPSGSWRWHRRVTGDPIRELKKQNDNISALAEKLRNIFPTLSFAVAGIGTASGMPSWVRDCRMSEIDETLEPAWCRLYAESHVVVGIHGSNMLLPSAHAGAVVELMPANRWGNIVQDVLLRSGETNRESLFRYRFIPASTDPDELSSVVSSLINHHESMMRNMSIDCYARGEDLKLSTTCRDVPLSNGKGFGPGM